MNRKLSFFILHLFVLVIAGETLAQDERLRGADSYEGEMESSSYSFESTDKGWSQREKLGQPLTGAPQPDEEVLAKIQVKWGQVEIDRLGESLTIRGQLHIPSPTDANLMIPINWQQGITVAISRRPSDEKPGQIVLTSDHSKTATCITDVRGEFRVKIDAEELQRNIAEETKFRCAIALATHSHRGKKTHATVITWRSVDKVFNKSNDELVVPANPQLDRTINLIRVACSDHAYDPNAIIEVVNALQPLGKEAALQQIETFLDLKEKSKGEYDLGTNGVFWILRVLFEPIEFGKKIPPPHAFVNHVRGPVASHWPLNPIVVVGDIPFSVGYPIGGSGTVESPRSHIEFVKRYCVIRDAPLRPTEDAMKLAERLIASPLIAGMTEIETDISAIRNQAASMRKNGASKP